MKKSALMGNSEQSRRGGAEEEAAGAFGQADAVALIRTILVIIRDEGGDADATLRSSGYPDSLSDFLDGDRPVSQTQLHEISLSCFLALQDLAYPNQPRDSEIGDWRLLIYLMLSAPTLRAAVERGRDFMTSINGRLGDLLVVEDGSVARIHFDRRRAASRAEVVTKILALANIHGLLCWLIGHSIPLVRATLPRTRASAKLAVDLTHIRLEESEQTTLAFEGRYLDYPVVRTAADLDARGNASFIFDGAPTVTVSILRETAYHAIYAALLRDGRMLSLQEVGAQLGFSRDQVRREFHLAGTSYNMIKDACRRDLSRLLVGQGDGGIEEIAARLDFCDSDAFRKAFRRWFGMSPSEYRRVARRRLGAEISSHTEA